MDKGKGKKKETSAGKSGSKATKKKTTTKKTEKSAKKKKTTKKSSKNIGKNEKNESNVKEGGESVLVDQNENGEDNQNIEDKLNQPLSKKKLPPIEKNNEIENEKEEEKVEEKIEEKEEIKNVEISIGTPYFYNIEGLKKKLEEKNNKINEENNDQENYKISLNNLLNDLNKILSENVDLLYNDEEDEIKKKKQANINYLQNILFSYQQKIKDSKVKNKLYKEHYDLLFKKDENIKMANAKEYEALIEEKKSDNFALNKKIIKLKETSQVEGKKLAKYSENVKYPQDINNLTNQLKTLSKKKADYFSKLNKNKKTLVTCQKELQNLENVYKTQKEKNKYFNARVEEEINRLKEDLTGNEEEIYSKVEYEKTFIQKKQVHQEKVNSVFNVKSFSKASDTKKLKFKKGTSLEPLNINRKAIRYDVRSGYNTRRMNIIAKNKSPMEIGAERNKTKENINSIKEKDILEEDYSGINYNSLTDFEYRELLTKKEHYYDVTSRLEKSIKEAQKMYTRKIKELTMVYDDNSKKLSIKKHENELLQSEINDLKKILSLTEVENKINSNKIDNNTKTKTNNNPIDEKELESHKEYLSPEYYQMNKNKNPKDKTLVPTNSNNDLTGNEILNELKGMNENNSGNQILLEQGGRKLSNLGMKFPDLSNIEEDKGDKMIRNNEFDRNKVLDDIKKKYNIKKSSNLEENDNNEIQIDDNELNFDDINEKKKETEDKELDKERDKEIEDEKIFFKEHENILKQEEGQFEPPIDNNVELENNNEIEDINEIKDNEKDKIDNDENKLTEIKQLDKDHVNYKEINKEEENNNIDNLDNNKENQDNKVENNVIEKDVHNMEHQDDILIEGTHNENEENKEENINGENKEENMNGEKEKEIENDNNVKEEDNQNIENEIKENKEGKENEELKEEKKEENNEIKIEVINDNINDANENKEINDIEEINNEKEKEENKEELKDNENENKEEIIDDKKEEEKKEKEKKEEEKKEEEKKEEDKKEEEKKEEENNKNENEKIKDEKTEEKKEEEVEKKKMK